MVSATHSSWFPCSLSRGLIRARRTALLSVSVSLSVKLSEEYGVRFI